MPPTTPVREAILEAMRAELAAITAGDDYFYAPTLVTRVEMNPTTDVTALVYVLLAPTDEPVDPLVGRQSSGGISEFFMRVTVRALIRAETASDTLGNQIYHDVRKKLLQDPTHGGLAIDTLPAGCQVVAVDDMRPMGWLEVYFSVHYGTSFADPSDQK